jgi:hypothetical protein
MKNFEATGVMPDPSNLKPSLRAQRSNPSRHTKKEWIASLRSQ